MTEPARIFDLLSYHQSIVPESNVFNYKKDGKWIGVPISDFIHRVSEISKALIANHVKPGDKVAVISENRLEWNLLDFAIQQVGGVLVAIYPNISDNDYEFILNDAEVNLCFVSTDALYLRLLGIKERIPAVKQVFTFNKYQIIPFWEEVLEGAKRVSDTELDVTKSRVKADDLATLIYTSGTTGKPKGVMLTHENLLADVTSSVYSFPVTIHDRALSFLPACHAYERVFQYVYIKIGMSIYFAQSMDSIGEDMREVKPHIFSAVPRVLEKVYEKIVAKGKGLTGVKRSLFFWALDLGAKYEFDESKLSGLYKFQLGIARKLIFSKWQEALGGQIKGIASGSATLQTKLIKLYWAAGISIFEGYGLTEAGPCLAVNCYKRGKHVGTVGVPLINIDIKLAEDGEILARGKNIMKGYYKNPEATAEVLKEGWLYTGDIGEWVEGKYLKIIDRKKELIKTSGGKYIVPQQLESKFSESEFIQQIMVIGEGRKFPSALIVPDFGKLNDWLRKEDDRIVEMLPEILIKHPKVKAKIQEEVNRLNQNFGNWERIKDFVLMPNEFTIETGELTPTLKIKRKVTEQKYKEIIEGIYS